MPPCKHPGKHLKKNSGVIEVMQIVSRVDIVPMAPISRAQEAPKIIAIYIFR